MQKSRNTLIITGKDLKKAVRILGITQEAAAEKMGISRATISAHMGRGELSPQFVQDVKTKLGIDLHNVKIGKIFGIAGGKQIDEPEPEEPEIEVVRPTGEIVSQKPNRRKGAGLIPFYNADFMAGSAEVFYEDATIYPEYYMDVPEFAGCVAFPAFSDSMERRIRSGSILFGTKVVEWQTHLEYGQIYGITCTDHRRYLKYIRKDPDDYKNYFLLRSENPDYDDFNIPKSAVKNIWLIWGWLNKNT